MKVAFFSTKDYDRIFFDQANESIGHDLHYLHYQLNSETVGLVEDEPAVCVFVNDELDAEVLRTLQQRGVRLVVLRCAGFNNVDLVATEKLDISVVRVPAYSPNAVAEHTLGLMLSLNRKIHRAYNRVREGNFSLDGLLGFDLNGRTVGIIGTGRIGRILARILLAIGCKIIASDPLPCPECEQMGVRYVELTELFQQSDIISLHCPLNCDTHHLINESTIAQMKQGIMIINTSRGATLDARAVIIGLKSGKIGYLGLDVYEQEGDLFFQDLSGQIIQDDVFERLVSFPNVLITGHQGFFTEDALQNIAQTTLGNISDIEKNGKCINEISSSLLREPCE